MALFRSITPLVEPLSLDEAFLDVSGAGAGWATPGGSASTSAARVYDEQGITCSVGVAGTKFVAKLASTRAKPDGLLVVRPAEVMDFLHPLPVGALWGVGAKTEEVLLRLGLRTVGDLAHVPARTLQRALGHAAGAHLHELAWGRDPRRVVPDEPDRSTGARRPSAPTSTTRWSSTASCCTWPNGRRGGCARPAPHPHGDPQGALRRLHHDHPVAHPEGAHRRRPGAVRHRPGALRRPRAGPCPDPPGRRPGRGAGGGRQAPRQLELGAREHGRRDAELAADRAARRFGAGAVRPATLLTRGHTRRHGRSSTLLRGPAARASRDRPGSSRRLRRLCR